MKDDLNTSKYPDTEYESSPSSSLNISFCCVGNFSTWFTVSDLIDAFKIAPVPDGIISILLEVEYPIPALRIFTSLIFSLVITALSLAPVPDPVGSETINSGTEKYSNPPNWRLTSFIDPFTITGSKLALLPFLKVNDGFFSTFKISDPYFVPSS